MALIQRRHVGTELAPRSYGLIIDKFAIGMRMQLTHNYVRIKKLPYMLLAEINLQLAA